MTIASDNEDYDPLNPFRSKRTTYVLPNYNESYKAAYYDPNKSRGAGYWDYPTKSDSAPVAVASGTGTEGNGNNEAVYNGQAGAAEVTKAGGLSPYGIMGLGGNVWELEESTYDISSQNYNQYGSASRGIRGGYWYYFLGPEVMSSSTRGLIDPYGEDLAVGFRVATLNTQLGQVPEPTSMAIFGLGALGFIRSSRRCVLQPDKA